MRIIPAFLLALSISAAPARPDDKPVAGPSGAGESFAAVKKEYDAARKAYLDDYLAARKKGDEGIKAFLKEKVNPAGAFAPRFLAVAERHPEGPDAIEALKMTFATSLGSQGKAAETRAGAVRILREHYVTRPEIKGFLELLIRSDDEGCRKLVGEIIARNPDRGIQAAAYKDRIAECESVASFLDWLADPKRREALEKNNSKEALARRTAQAEQARSQLAGLKATLREKYPEFYHDLSVGHAAPEFVMQDVDGKTVRLSDLRGKVVVLDIWATWCGPCLAMIPHEREMVERLKGKPFQLVGVSIDDEVKTLRDFLAREKLPWTHWWAGPGGRESKLAEGDPGHPGHLRPRSQGRDPVSERPRRGAGEGRQRAAERVRSGGGLRQPPDVARGRCPSRHSPSRPAFGPHVSSRVAPRLPA